MANLPVHRGNGGRALGSRMPSPLEQMGREFDRIFERAFGGGLAPWEEDFADMRVWDFDVRDDNKELVVRAEIPGFEPNEVDIQLNNDVLTIKAEKREKAEGEEEYRSFYRSVTLPAGIDADKAQANFRNGVLELHLPKTEQARQRTRKIALHS